MNEKRLTRMEEGRMIAGVCAGLGRYLGIDATIVRIIFVLLALFAMGGVLLSHPVADHADGNGLGRGRVSDPPLPTVPTGFIAGSADCAYTSQTGAAVNRSAAFRFVIKALWNRSWHSFPRIDGWPWPAVPVSYTHLTLPTSDLV